MKIMIISSIFPPGFKGGYELAALDIARGLHQAGHHVTVVTSDFFLDMHQSIQEFPVHRILEYIVPHSSFALSPGRQLYHEGFLFNFRNIRLLSNLLLTVQPHALLCFDLRGLGTLGLLKYMVSLGYHPVLNLGDNIFADLDDPSLDLSEFCDIFGSLHFLAQVDKIVLSSSIINRMAKSLGFELKNLTILPRWYHHQSAAALLNFKKDFTDKTKFVFASTLEPHKGIDLIIEATQKLLALGIVAFTIDLYGGGEVSAVNRQIIAKGLQDHIRYCGLVQREQLPDILVRYHALLFPTWITETFGAIVAEASAVGCIPILTRGIGAAEWFLHGIDCFKIERNIAGLTKTMMEFIQLSVGQKLSMSQYTCATARKFFDFSNILKATEQVICSAMLKQQNILCPIKSQAAMLILKNIWEDKRCGK